MTRLTCDLAYLSDPPTCLPNPPDLPDLPYRHRGNAGADMGSSLINAPASSSVSR